MSNVGLGASLGVRGWNSIDSDSTNSDSERRVRRRVDEAQPSASGQVDRQTQGSAMDVESVSSESPEANTGLSNSPVHAEIEASAIGIQIQLTDKEAKKLKNNWKIELAPRLIREMQQNLSREQIVSVLSKSNQKDFEDEKTGILNLKKIIVELKGKGFSEAEISKVGVSGLDRVNQWMANHSDKLSKKQLLSIAKQKGGYVCLDYLESYWGDLVTEDRFDVEQLVSIASNDGAKQALTVIKDNWGELITEGRFDVEQLVSIASNK